MGNLESEPCETAPPTCPICGETCGDHLYGCPNEPEKNVDHD